MAPKKLRTNNNNVLFVSMLSENVHLIYPLNKITAKTQTSLLLLKYTCVLVLVVL